MVGNNLPRHRLLEAIYQEDTLKDFIDLINIRVDLQIRTTAFTENPPLPFQLCIKLMASIFASSDFFLALNVFNCFCISTTVFANKDVTFFVDKHRTCGSGSLPAVYLVLTRMIVKY